MLLHRYIIGPVETKLNHITFFANFPKIWIAYIGNQISFSNSFIEGNECGNFTNLSITAFGFCFWLCLFKKSFNVHHAVSCLLESICYSQQGVFSKPISRYIITLLNRGITLFEISYTMGKNFTDWFLNKLGMKNRFNYFFSNQ